MNNVLFCFIATSVIISISMITEVEAKCLNLDENNNCLDERFMPSEEQPYTNSSAADSRAAMPLLIAALSAAIGGVSVATLYPRVRQKVKP